MTTDCTLSHRDGVVSGPRSSRPAISPSKWIFALFAIVAVAWMSVEAQQQGIFRLLTFQVGGQTRLGATTGNGEADIVDIHNAISALTAIGAPEARNLAYIPADMKSLIEAGTASVTAVKTVFRAAGSLRAGGKLVDPGGDRRVFYPHTAVRIREPILNPKQMFGIAGNYNQVGETAKPAPPPTPTPAPAASALGRAPNRDLPSIFLKAVSSLVGQDDEIVMTTLLKDGFPSTHEAELGVVIGRRAKNVSEAQAMDYVFGYTVHNDVSGRTLQTGASGSEGSALTKGLDTFGPTGPYITLKEDVPDIHNLAIETKLNGKVFPMPNAHTRNMRHRVPTAVSFLSQIMTLEPGDIIATGVPAPTAPLTAGDTVEITIERLGTLRNRVVTVASRPRPPS